MHIENMKFEIGFWHPFGPHAGEEVEDIIKRKQKEIKENGWTLWSFQHRTKDTLDAWHKEIEIKNPSNVLVFCSKGIGAKAPAGETKYCEWYLPIKDISAKKIPSSIKVPHPMGDKTIKGSAFIVKNIIYPVSYEETPIEWFKNNQWQTTSLPTRPEYLIKAGNGQSIKPFRAVLELLPPYLARIGIFSDAF